MPRLTALIAAAASLLAAHAQAATNPPPSAPAGPYPANYDQIIHTELDNLLKDPGSAQVKISRPPRKGTRLVNGATFWRPAETAEIYFVCYQINSKNSYGGYVGFHQYLFGITNGTVAYVRSSPYFNEYSGREILNEDVDTECAKPADKVIPDTSI